MWPAEQSSAARRFATARTCAREQRFSPPGVRTTPWCVPLSKSPHLRLSALTLCDASAERASPKERVFAIVRAFVRDASATEGMVSLHSRLELRRTRDILARCPSLPRCLPRNPNLPLQLDLADHEALRQHGQVGPSQGGGRLGWSCSRARPGESRHRQQSTRVSEKESL